MKPKDKKNLSDKISRRPRPTPTQAVKRNPFELYLAKAKHVVLGRAASNPSAAPALGKLRQKQKHGQRKQTVEIQTQGIRTVSRSTAMQNRKKTLLNEYKTRTKNNKMVDRRLGEKDATMTVEDKMMERVMFERTKSAKSRSNRFSLKEDFGEDEDDGGFGQTLADIERMEDDYEAEPFEEDNDDILGEKFVAEHHFGGGLLKKVVVGQGEEQRPDVLRVERKQIVDDIIAESKQKKFAKQTELDEVRDMTKSLDDKWSDAVVRKLISSSFNQPVPEPPVESYDSLVKMLQFDSKAKGSNKMKSDAELAKEAKEELEAAEKRRLKSHTSKKSHPDEIPEHSTEELRNTVDGEIELLDPDIDEEILDEDDSGPEDYDEELDTVLPSFSGEPSEIPFIIPVPTNRTELEKLLVGRGPEDMVVIVTRIIKYHHISLAEGNREKLYKFFKLLFSHLLTLCDANPESCLSIWNLMTPTMHELFQISGEKSDEFIRLRLAALAKLANKKKKYVPPSSAFVFLKFVSLCYPIDKHYHPTVALLNLLLGTLLTNASFPDTKSVMSGVFIATLAAEIAEKSRRYFPELIGFLLRGLSYCAATVPIKTFVVDPSIVYSFGDFFDERESYTDVSSYCSKFVNFSLGLLEKLVEVYVDLPACAEIFQGPVVIFNALRCSIPPGAGSRLESFGKLVAEKMKPRPYLAFFKKKPASLKMLEPRIDNKFDRSKNAKKAAVKRLTHDKKRAVKGAKRELRRDNQFIARVQLDEQLKKDVERTKKVKEIYTGLYTQQSEHKALQRQKSKFKV